MIQNEETNKRIYLPLCNMKYFLIFFSFLTLSFVGKTQNPCYINYTIDDGLASNEVYNVLEDKKGNIWFATDQGVSKFNGYEFKNFTVKDGLPNNTIFDFFEDHNGKIWMRSFYGHLSYLKDDVVHTILPDKEFGLIYSIYVDNSDTIWVSEGGKQHKIYSKVNGKGYHHQELDRFYQIRKIDNSKHGVLCGMKFYMNNINALLPLKKEFQVNKIKPNYKSSVHHIYNSFNRSDTEIWADFDNKILSFKDDTMLVIKKFDAKDVSLSITKDNEVFVGGSKGAHLLDETYEIKQRFLDQLHVTSVIKDRENGYWFSTLSNGVFYTPNLKVKVYKFESNSGILDIIRTKDQLLVFDYYGDIYNDTGDSFQKTYDNKVSQREFLEVRLNESGGAVIRNIGQILISKNNRFIEKNVGYKDYAYKNYVLNNRYEIRVGSGDISVKNLESNKEILYLIIGKRLTRSKPLVYNDTIFIPTTRGLIRYDIENGPLFYKDQFELLAHRINSVAVDKHGRLWIATNESGLLLLEKNQLKSIDSDEDSKGTICRNVIVDELYAWTSTEQGLMRVELENPDAVEYCTTEDGLLSNGINCLYLDHEYILVGHDEGITKFPTNYKKKTVPPKIRIDEIQIKHKTVPLQKSYELDHRTNSLKIYFTGISYSDNLSYKYKLASSETSNWNYTNDRSVEFISIPPGEYTFHVMAINSSGITSGEPLSISFTITPAIWSTWWFYLTTLLLLGSGVYTYIYFRLKRMKFKLETEKKLIHIEQQALRARMNPHFIFNSMNSIQTFILSNDKRSANKYLATFSKLMRSILENSEKRLIPISNELETLKTYAEIEALRFKNKFIFSVQTTESLNLDELKIPPMLLQPYVENAIWHGIMPKESRGTISVVIDGRDNFILCSIEDNGIGREKARQLREEKNVSYESAGLKITANRLELVKILYSVDVSIDFIDLVENGIAVGTRVEIQLPYLK